MKKFILCIALLLTFVACFTACNKNKEDESTSESVMVESQSSAASISFVKNEVNMKVGEQVQLEVVTSNPNAFVFWEIVDKKIATVSAEGVVTAIAEGQTICYAEYAGQRVACLIKVEPQSAEPLISVSIPYANNSAVLYAGDSLDVNATVKLGDAVLSGASVEYSLDVEGVISIENGVILAEGVGTATVTVVATYEGQTASVQLVVEVLQANT